MREGRICAFNRACSVSFPRACIFSRSSFFIFLARGLQGAKSFVRDRNGLRISGPRIPNLRLCTLFLSLSLARALGFPLTLSLASEILKAPGGIKEISLPQRVGPSEDLRLLSFFRYEASAQYARHRKLSRMSPGCSRISGDSLRQSDADVENIPAMSLLVLRVLPQGHRKYARILWDRVWKNVVLRTRPNLVRLVVHCLLNIMGRSNGVANLGNQVANTSIMVYECV